MSRFATVQRLLLLAAPLLLLALAPCGVGSSGGGYGGY